VAPLEVKTVIFTGAGAILGAVIAALFSLFGDSERSEDEAIGPIVAGTLSGIIAGFTIGKHTQNGTANPNYFCMDCFHTFTMENQGCYSESEYEEEGEFL
jgi:hypothetical protein